MKAGYERIIVRPIVEEKRIGGIIVNIKKSYEVGEVLSIDEDAKMLTLNPGDKVYIHNNSGIEIECDGEKLWSVHRSSVLGFDSI